MTRCVCLSVDRSLKLPNATTSTATQHSTFHSKLQNNNERNIVARVNFLFDFGSNCLKHVEFCVFFPLGLGFGVGPVFGRETKCESCWRYARVHSGRAKNAETFSSNAISSFSYYFPAYHSTVHACVALHVHKDRERRGRV